MPLIGYYINARLFLETFEQQKILQKWAIDVRSIKKENTDYQSTKITML